MKSILFICNAFRFIDFITWAHLSFMFYQSTKCAAWFIKREFYILADEKKNSIENQQKWQDSTKFVHFFASLWFTRKNTHLHILLFLTSSIPPIFLNYFLYFLAEIMQFKNWFRKMCFILHFQLPNFCFSIRNKMLRVSCNCGRFGCYLIFTLFESITIFTFRPFHDSFSYESEWFARNDKAFSPSQQKKNQVKCEKSEALCVQYVVCKRRYNQPKQWEIPMNKHTQTSDC